MRMPLDKDRDNPKSNIYNTLLTGKSEGNEFNLENLFLEDIRKFSHAYSEEDEQIVIKCRGNNFRVNYYINNGCLITTYRCQHAPLSSYYEGIELKYVENYLKLGQYNFYT